VIQGNYLYHDDYYLLSISDTWSQHPQYLGYKKYSGRPLGIMIKCFYSSFFDEPQRANIARFFSILATWFLGVLLFIVLCYLMHSVFLSMLTSVCIITLLPFQHPNASIANVPYLYAGIFGVLSSLIIIFFIDWKQWEQKIVFNKRNIILMLLSAVFFLIGLWTYQSAVYLYTFSIVLFILHKHFKTIKSLFRILAGTLLPLFTAAICYSIWFKITQIAEPGSAVNIISKISWFYNIVIPRIFSFWSLKRTWIGFIIFMCLICIMIILWLLKQFKDNHRMCVLWKNLSIAGIKFLSVVIISILTYLPSLMSAYTGFVYRTMIAVQAVFFVIAVFCIWEIFFNLSNFMPNRVTRKIFNPNNILVILLFLGMFIGIYTAHNNVMNLYVIPQTMELRLVRNVLKHTNLTGKTHIHVVRPKNSHAISGYSDGNDGDEFGAMTTSFRNDTYYFVKLGALKQINNTDEFTITSGNDRLHYDSPAPVTTDAVPKDAVIIDMNELVKNLYA
ncbi:hypothetical protein ACFL4O_00990, partial [bacterium]